MTQYGFYFDQSRCTNCHACVIACRDWNDIESGPVKWVRMMQWEKGSYPNPAMHTLFATCYHCEQPSCVLSCPNDALVKEDEFGAVLLDVDRCKGSRKCWQACPYGAPQYDSDKPGAKMSKCDMCYDKLAQGEQPVCVASCPQRALDFGPMDELIERYGDLRQLEDMPSPATKPAAVFKPRAQKQLHVPYDEARVLELMAKRGDSGLPDLYQRPEDVTAAYDGFIGYDKLVLKASSVEETLARSKNEEA